MTNDEKAKILDDIDLQIFGPPSTERSLVDEALADGADALRSHDALAAEQDALVAEKAKLEEGAKAWIEHDNKLPKPINSEDSHGELKGDSNETVE